MKPTRGGRVHAAAWQLPRTTCRHLGVCDLRRTGAPPGRPARARAADGALLSSGSRPQHTRLATPLGPNRTSGRAWHGRARPGLKPQFKHCLARMVAARSSGGKNWRVEARGQGRIGGGGAPKRAQAGLRANGVQHTTGWAGDQSAHPLLMNGAAREGNTFGARVSVRLWPPGDVTSGHSKRCDGSLG